MQSWGFLVLRTGVEWRDAVLNSQPPTGTSLHAHSSVAGQKTQWGNSVEGKRGSVCIQKGLKEKARGEMGTLVNMSDPWRRKKAIITTEGGVSIQGCDLGETSAA